MSTTTAGTASRSRIWPIFTALLPYAALILIFAGMGARDLYNMARVDKHGRGPDGRPPVYFCTQKNLMSPAMDCAPVIIAAAGMTLVMLTGGIDLSVGSIIGVAAAVAALGTNFLGGIPWAMKSSVCVPLGMTFGVLAGTLCGAINGTLVIGLRLPPFVVTLGTLISLRGVCRLLNGNTTSVIIGFNTNNRSAILKSFKWLAESKLPYADMPVFVPLAVALVAVLWIMLNYTRLGRRIYAVGSNEEAARLSGVRVGLTKLAAYTIAGMTAGIAGVMYAARLGGSDANQGFMSELDIIAGVVIGGTALSGGKGTVTGCVVGVVLMKILKSASTSLHVDDTWEKVIIGLFLIGAAAINSPRSSKTT